MTMLRTSFSLAAVAMLAACVTSEPVTPVPSAVLQQQPATVLVPQGTVAPGGAIAVVPAATAVQPGVPLRAGTGRVETITKLSKVTGGGIPRMHRVGLMMDDGGGQFVDTYAEHLSVGDRVEITPDARIRYPVSQGPTRY